MNSPDVKKLKQRNRRVLITIALVFVLPLLAAKLVLSLGWYETGVSQKGHLVDPPIVLAENDNALLPNTWRIAYRMPAECAEACENALYVSGQIFHALGRQQNRVSAVAIGDENSASELPALPADNTVSLHILPYVASQLAELPEHSLMIIDPVGNVVMWYPGSSDRQEVVMRGRDLLSDLQKLLKLSRVG
ncbi:hypothetical protein FM042_08445 [Aliidiomarina halalkaliphila]|uniref:Cytochrome oxidase assembly protein n=1 Tax=Aliidiomarina halalkaliphila TaxID=2593535 RepID=A0A552X1S5_9GAMM|nr:hypothetical protein [Aliidiomarina halalkaliphila]TRW49000.1 hypothetical protein FM042_08445 [Aliidiomarina halalkaliphila]